MSSFVPVQALQRPGSINCKAIAAVAVISKVLHASLQGSNCRGIVATAKELQCMKILKTIGNKILLKTYTYTSMSYVYVYNHTEAVQTRICRHAIFASFSAGQRWQRNHCHNQGAAGRSRQCISHC